MFLLRWPASHALALLQGASERFPSLQQVMFSTGQWDKTDEQAFMWPGPLTILFPTSDIPAAARHVFGSLQVATIAAPGYKLRKPTVSMRNGGYGYNDPAFGLMTLTRRVHLPAPAPTPLDLAKFARNHPALARAVE